MDLPTELRLCIAEYALISSLGHELFWHWSVNAYACERKVVGCLLNLDAITPLRLVSRQIYKETEGLVWKVNTFYFDEDDLGLSHWERFGSPRGAVEQAFKYFVRNVGSKATSHIRSLVFKVCVQDWGLWLKTFLDWLTELIEPFPAAQVQIHDFLWQIYQDGFWEAGHKYKDELAKAGYGDKNARNWRIFPIDLNGEGEGIPDKLAAVLDEAQLAEVMDWLKNGI
jgi:hypothetical protein